MAQDKIVIRGAREHNLKNLHLEIPRDKLVVITGLSGSGKSSLAFDTIYAEGQRRYVESLSAYARQFLEQMEKPDVDTIEGLSPAISIEQKTTSRNPRSTVGTVTEIHDYLRLLFARVGRPHCPECGKEIKSQTVQQIVDQVMGLPPGSRVQILAPIVRGRKGEFRKEFDHLRKSGYVRMKVDGTVRDLSEEILLDKNKKHTLDVLVDRLVVKENVQKRLADSLATALNLSEGIAKVEIAWGKSWFSARSSPAWTAGSACRRSAPACSPSTTPMAPARSATAWARRCTSIRIRSCPTPISRSGRGLLSPGRGGVRCIFTRPSNRSGSIIKSICTPRSGASLPRRSRPSFSARTASRSNFTATGPTAGIFTTGISRGSSPAWNGDTGKPIRRSFGKRWKST